MRFGFVRMSLLGCAVLWFYGAGTASAQLTSPILSQGLGGGSGQQSSSSCNPTDPSCAAYNQQIPTSPTGTQSQSQGINLDRQQMLNEQLPTQSQQQRVQLQETNLPLDPPTEF